jgi:hypothetical protein
VYAPSMNDTPDAVFWAYKIRNVLTRFLEFVSIRETNESEPFEDAS